MVLMPLLSRLLSMLIFLFQAEDGIRDLTVTGVQTCALPIFSRRRPLKRTSKRLATLLHAISKTNATAARRVANAGRKFPVTSSGSVFNVITEELSILSGCCAR